MPDEHKNSNKTCKDGGHLGRDFCEPSPKECDQLCKILQSWHASPSIDCDCARMSASFSSFSSFASLFSINEIERALKVRQHIHSFLKEEKVLLDVIALQQLSY